MAVIAIGQFVTEPLAKAIGLHSDPGAAANALGAMKGNLWTVAKGLALVWTLGAFGEEIGYRRYLLGRAADMAAGTPLAYWIGLVYVSVLFGFGHCYQGPAGRVHDPLRRIRDRRSLPAQRPQSVGCGAGARVDGHHWHRAAVLRARRLAVARRRCCCARSCKRGSSTNCRNLPLTAWRFHRYILTRAAFRQTGLREKRRRE